MGDTHQDQLTYSEDLTASFSSDLYEIPNNDRRRIAGFLYVAIGVLSLGLGVFASASPLVNDGFVYGGTGILCVALYCFVASVTTKIDETEAFELAIQDVGFTTGPASAQMMWRGWGSKPVWRLLLYSAETQPLHRAFVIVDASSGQIIERFVEDNPEDWN